MTRNDRMVRWAFWVSLGLTACIEEASDLGVGAGGSVSTPMSLRFLVNQRPHDPTSSWEAVEEGRWVDPMRVVVTGLRPGEAIRLETSLGSWAELEADADGTVDLARDTPIEGTWTVVDADGIYWSSPATEEIQFDIAISVTSLDQAERQVKRTYRRAPIDEAVVATPIADGTTVGTIVRPTKIPEGERRPAILAFGGSEGGTFSGEIQAYSMAQLGYVSMGVGYFAAPGLPADLDRVPLEILENDLAFLASQADVDPERIAVIGGSRGGELALLLGSTFPDRVHAVVAEVPSGLVWGSVSGTENTSAWTLDGVEVPFIERGDAFPDSYVEDGERHYILTPMFQRSLMSASATQRANATIDVRNTSGPILFLGGERDALWPSCELAKVSWDLLEQADRNQPDVFHCLEGAGHASVGLPGLSTLESDAYYLAENAAWMDLGGSPEANARGIRKSNTERRAFLERAFAYREKRWE